MILDLLNDGTPLNVKREGIEPSLLTAFHEAAWGEIIRPFKRRPATKLSGVLATLDVSPSRYSGGLPGEPDK
ncbi:MAG: hypothetical protein KME06_16395 [Kastovskya adunca ATA6-11-RM4]|nr:hypothetical protein [Kastovskya adunca ATA6-11-RM4]